MSFLDKARRRLSESGLGRRGSLPGVGTVSGSPVTPSPLAAAMSKNEVNTSNISLSGRWDNGPIIEQEKTDPSEYLFLIRTDPLLDWEESKTLETNELDPFDGLSIELKVYHNKTRDNNSVCRILSKFADESIDDYLFEIGILTEVLPKFDDYINEIEALRECRNHRNILDFYDAYYFDSKLWIFTEYCSFGSIEKLLYDLKQPLNMMQIHYVLKEVLFGLDFLHNRLKICHRDMQCANLFIGDDLSIKISNFTLSAKVNASKDKVILPPKAPHFIQMEVLKRGYYFVRSPHYASPEEVRSYSNQYDNPKSDIWGLGITCIEMAEQFPPLKSLSAEAVIQAINEESFKPTLKEQDKWDPSFVDFVGRCLNRNVDLRASVKDLIEHEFITKFKNQSSKSDMQQVLADRKKALYAESQKILANLDQTVQSLKLVEEQPDKFIQSYFDNLRSSIDAKAREAAEKIEQDRANMIDMMNKYQELCVTNLNKRKYQPFSESIEEIISEAKDNLSKWNESLSKTDLNEQELNKTNADSSHYINETQTELNKIKLQLFGDKVYQLEPSDKQSIKFGELVALDSKDLLGEDSIHNVNNYEKTHRPINKLIRFDLKGTKRK